MSVSENILLDMFPILSWDLRFLYWLWKLWPHDTIH